MSRFSGKVAIVTGSSSGIGRATAILLASEGASVTITGRNSKNLETVRAEISKLGARVNVVVGDITDTKCQDELIESTIKQFGKIDILINNAGAAFPDESGISGLMVPIGILEKTLKLNLTSVVELTQKCRQHLIDSKGEVVNVSSIAAGPQAFCLYTYYAMAKAALDQMTRCFALELIKSDVRVNSVSPGLVGTDFLTAYGLDTVSAKKVEHFHSSNRESIPAGVIGKSEDIAKLIAFLADRNSSSYIIGQSFVIDGGTSLVMGMSNYDVSKILA